MEEERSVTLKDKIIFKSRYTKVEEALSGD
jgi:hypothetical protein